MTDRTLLGVRIGPRPLTALVEAAEASLRERATPFVFACANPHSLVVAASDAEFRTALNAASAVVADGVGCTLVARVTGVPVGPRITGSDFFAAIMGLADRNACRVLFFGSSEYVLSHLRAKVAANFPNTHLMMISPPFGAWSTDENDRLLAQVAAFAPDILWVGMTAPKQEKWVHANLCRLNIPVIGSIGAVFDYYAGLTPRAPNWVCRLGLEWLYRLPREPKRLWRRTLVSAPKFVWLVFRDRLSLR